MKGIRTNGHTSLGWWRLKNRTQARKAEMRVFKEVDDWSLRRTFTATRNGVRIELIEATGSWHLHEDGHFIACLNSLIEAEALANARSI